MLLGSGAGVHEQIGKKYYVTGHQMLSVNLKKIQIKREFKQFFYNKLLYES